MFRKFTGSLIFLAMRAVGGTSQAAAILYGATNNGTLYTIDLGTGISTPVGPIGDFLVSVRWRVGVGKADNATAEFWIEASASVGVLLGNL
jgi:hypothetical protein